MDRMGKIAGSLSLAVALAVGMTVGTAAAAPHDAAHSQQNVTFFLADPELGLAGVYSDNGAEVYFEARRELDEGGAPGALALRVVDAHGRTLALAGEPAEQEWLPRTREFTVLDGYADPVLLTGLGEALQGADLHVALAAEKSGLASLAMQTAGTPAAQLPVRAEVDAGLSAAADVSQLADFYARAAPDVHVSRDRDGILQANLGNGIVFLSKQEFIADEPDEDGRMGRIDAYAMVRAADGFVLSAELGGDEAPAEWSDAIELGTERDHNALAADFGRAATALQALSYSGRATRGVTLSHHAERDAMHRLARMMTSNLLPERVEDSERQLTRTGMTPLSSGAYQTAIQVWRKPFVVIAEHSATRVARYRYAASGARTSLGWVSYCNHGTCAAGTNMTRKCTYTGPRMGYLRLPSRRSDAGGHTCSTPYWAVGRAGHHNCHDDSSKQVKAVRGQAYSVNSGRCSSRGFSAYAPGCGVQ